MEKLAKSTKISCQKIPKIPYSPYSHGLGTGHEFKFATHFCNAKTAMSPASASSSPSDASMCELFCSRASCLWHIPAGAIGTGEHLGQCKHDRHRSQCKRRLFRRNTDL